MNRNPSDLDLEPVDRALRAYFRSVLPDPWPDAPQVADSAARQSGPVRTLRSRARPWAVAASVLLLVLGYLSVARFFPKEESQALSVDPTHRTIGSLPGRQKAPLVDFDLLRPMPPLPPKH